MGEILSVHFEVTANTKDSNECDFRAERRKKKVVPASLRNGRPGRKRIISP